MKGGRAGHENSSGLTGRNDRQAGFVRIEKLISPGNRCPYGREAETGKEERGEERQEDEHPGHRALRAGRP